MFIIYKGAIYTIYHSYVTNNQRVSTVNGGYKPLTLPKIRIFHSKLLNHQRVTRGSPAGHQRVTRGSPEGHQRVTRGSPASSVSSTSEQVFCFVKSAVQAGQWTTLRCDQTWLAGNGRHIACASVFSWESPI